MKDVCGECDIHGSLLDLSIFGCIVQCNFALPI